MAEGLTQDEIDALMNMGFGSESAAEEEEETPEPAPSAAPASAQFAQPAGGGQAQPGAFTAQPQYTSSPQRPPRKMRRSPKIEDPINVQPAHFEDFDDEILEGDTTNLEIILNLDLEIRVELGKTTTTVRDVLEMGPGSVLELQKLNGEPVDLLVNQRPFSKGEMIVIGENFGVRVTDILSVTEIIEALR